MNSVLKSFAKFPNFLTQKIKLDFPNVNTSGDGLTNNTISGTQLIHDESDRIMAIVKSDQDLGEPEYPNDEFYLMDRLNHLGFVKQPEVVDFISKTEIFQNCKVDKNKRKDYAKNIRDYIVYYSGRYPNNRYVTYESISDICKEYDLSFLPNIFYDKDIPVKNKREIIDFNLLDDDKMVKVVNKSNAHYYSNKKKLDHLYFSKKTFHNIHHNNYRDLESKNVNIFKYINIVDRVEYDMECEDSSNKYIIYLSELSKYNFDTRSMYIMAPHKQFEQLEIERTPIEPNWIIAEGIQDNIKDSIVFLKVEGGYLLISSWT